MIKPDYAQIKATEALIGSQNDCNAMMKLTKEERNSLLLSVAAEIRDALAESRAAGLEEAAKLVESWAPPHGSDGKYEHMAKRIRDRNGVDANRHIPLGNKPE